MADESLRTTQFVRGLRPELRQALIVARVTDLDAAYQMATTLEAGATRGPFSLNFLPLLPTTFTPFLLHSFRWPTGACGQVVVLVAATDRARNGGTHNFFQGSVDTPHTGVDTMLQALSQKMKKWSSSVDTRSNGVDTRDLSQKACFAVLSCVSTRDEVVSTLETSPREVSLPIWDSVSTLDLVRSTHCGNFMT
ncbi:hypothetical protein Taro_011585 [Colocasia esculenta]|uniref:Uncharacterized protein n=1 Tax=Colocasia esculenta TaxID=4460 RepID=A0A843UAK2_COLES|nr:hypothetical protein [Colocasia esculenta]